MFMLSYLFELGCHFLFFVVFSWLTILTDFRPIHFLDAEEGHENEEVPTIEGVPECEEERYN